MEEINEDDNKTQPAFPLQRKSSRKQLPEVITVRNWKEYLGESLLIIFSVVLALILTEIFNKIHDDHQTAEVLRQLKLELMDNKRLETEQYHYHLQVLKSIDSLLEHQGYEKEFF